MFAHYHHHHDHHLHSFSYYLSFQDKAWTLPWQSTGWWSLWVTEINIYSAKCRCTLKILTMMGRTWTIPIQMSMISLVCCLCVQQDRSRKYCVVTQRISVNSQYNCFIFSFILKDTINIHRNSICLERFRRVHPFIVVNKTR